MLLQKNKGFVFIKPIILQHKKEADDGLCRDESKLCKTLFIYVLQQRCIMKITIINGPNLNLLGTREPTVYGSQTFEEYYALLKQNHPHIIFQYHQSNIEGELIDFLQKEGFSSDGIIINPGGYTHTSVAIGDAVAAITTPVVEVHISNIGAREEFRKISHVSAKCKGTISGLGLQGYELAVHYFMNNQPASKTSPEATK